MTAVSDTAINKNFLSPLGFKAIIKRAPSVNFFIQETMLPGLSIPPTYEATPLVRIPMSGDHIEFEDYKFTFKVDEDLTNWLEIFNWIQGLGRPFSPDQYATLLAQSTLSGGGIKSDISIFTLTGTKMPNINCTLIDAFPIALSGLHFTTMDTDVDYISAEATFKYTYYTLQKIIT